MAEEIQQVEEWVSARVLNEEPQQILLGEAINSTLNVYKKETEGWKKKL